MSEQDENPPRCLGDPEQRPAPYRFAGKPYSLLDCCWVLCAILVFFSDGATDLWLAADYYLRRDYWWFGLTLVFVVVPSTVVQVLSFRWFVYDYSDFSRDSGTVAAAAVGAAAAASGGDCNFSTKGSDQRGIANSATGSSPPATGTRRCCRVCMWLFQSVLHILQLGQVWR